ncbi:MAG: ATP synthase F1 subunit delta [Ruminococcaceae bacterium]|nr:ATP synthase F1 subunit delta [Oscillospiraceae bacterium]
MSEAAKEYGRALADLAVEENIEVQILEESRAIRSLLDANPAYVRLLSSPEIAKSERAELLDKAFGGRVHRHLLNFLKLIMERGYAYRSAAFLSEYESIYCERHGIITADVQSAIPLSEEQKSRLAQKLSTLTGKTVELSCKVDPALIGGIRLTVNNTLFEGSVRAKLDQMRASLASLTI